MPVGQARNRIPSSLGNYARRTCGSRGNPNCGFPPLPQALLRQAPLDQKRRRKPRVTRAIHQIRAGSGPRQHREHREASSGGACTVRGRHVDHGASMAVGREENARRRLCSKMARLVRGSCLDRCSVDVAPLLPGVLSLARGRPSSSTTRITRGPGSPASMLPVETALFFRCDLRYVWGARPAGIGNGRSGELYRRRSQRFSRIEPATQEFRGDL